MKKQLRGLFCAAALAAVLALPARQRSRHTAPIFAGYPDGSIQPGAPVTRAQLACALVRLAEEPLPEPERVTFFDVPGDHWACAQIGKLTGLGLLPFGDGGWFLPSAAVSWRELCGVLDTLADSETGREIFPALTGAWEEKTVFEAGQGSAAGSAAVSRAELAARNEQFALPQSGQGRCAAACRRVVLGQSGRDGVVLRRSDRGGGRSYLPRPGCGGAVDGHRLDIVLQLQTACKMLKNGARSL